MENIASLDALVSARDVEIGKTEEEVRVDLAACYRLMAVYGMTDLASNHITARAPGSHEHFFINPYGMLYEEITASSLHKIDLDGNIIERGDTQYGVNTAGYVIHSAIHAARHDLSCVLHTHTRAGVAISCMEGGLLPLNQNALQVFDRVRYHDYEGPATDQAERISLAEDLGDANILVLRNHGMLTCGRTIAEAFWMMYMIETACKIQLDVMASGDKLHFPSELAASHQTTVMDRLWATPRGNFEWPALKRKLDRILPGYAD